MFEHVLVADDDARTPVALSKVFRSCNAKITVTARVQDALAWLEHDPRLIVSEMTLGGDTCAPLWRALRSLKSRPPLLVVASATARPREVFRLQSLGAAAFLEKPLDDDELTDAIQQLALIREQAESFRAHSRIGSYAAQVSRKYGLTRAEGEVLECVLQRMTYEEVASHRRVSRNTIKTQMRVILEKCGATSLREIARDCLDAQGLAAAQSPYSSTSDARR